ncbi:MAG: 3-dehydroquinate synthase [Verrucomicrobiales bacterium]|nr:3-dehydroquinate synthase [Verrucomicrobiales bacterium]
MRTVKVPLGDRSYSIKIGNELLPNLGKECRRLKLGTRCALITDRKVGPIYSKTAMSSLRKSGFEPIEIRVPAGETAKSLKTIQSSYDKLAKHRIERSSFIVALGGGVVGDMAGFLAASYLRGIGFVQVPTTLLSQVDSSVGGKVGVNLKAGKNLVGAFYQPRLVLCDLNTIKTLPKRELRAGLAEVIKYGIIEDSKLFQRIERKMSNLLSLDTIEMAYIVARSCQIKAKIVEQDETENGLRAILNYGHTIGHALEAISSYGKFLHGEAISIGQVAASKISRDLLGLSQSEVDRIEALFTAAGLPTKINLSKNEMKKLLAAMKLDKKVTDGKVNFVLASTIGKVSFGIESPEANIKASLT